MSLDGTVTGDREVRASFARVTPEVRAELTKATVHITLKLMRLSVGSKLSGQVLKRRTGTLARSVTQSPRTFQVGQAIVGTVGVSDITGNGGRAPVKYGRAHEYGFQGAVSVKQHLRMIKQAFGKSLKSPVQVTVGAHTANVNLPERSFLRSALKELHAAGVITAEYEAAVQRGTEAAAR